MREQEGELQQQFQCKEAFSADLKALLTLMRLRYERYKEELVKRDSPETRGRAQEIQSLLSVIKKVDTDLVVH